MGNILKSVCITGPECSGKTTLATQLAAHFGCPLVSEYAREYLPGLKRPYAESDLLEIALRQFGAWQKLHANRSEDHHEEADWRTSEIDLVIIDTDLTVIKIWSMEKYGRVDAGILALLDQERFDLYLLCRPDLPWVADPLRENPHDRDRLFGLYEKELKEAQKNFVVVEGEARNEIAKQAIKLLF